MSRVPGHVASFEYRSRLAIPQHEVEMRQGDADLPRECAHRGLDLEVAFRGERRGDPRDDAERGQVFKHVPVQDGEVLSETRVAEEMARFLPAHAANVFDQEAPALDRVGDGGKNAFNAHVSVDRKEFAGPDEVTGLVVTETDGVDVSADFIGTPAEYEVIRLQALDRVPASVGG